MNNKIFFRRAPGFPLASQTLRPCLLSLSVRPMNARPGGCQAKQPPNLPRTRAESTPKLLNFILQNYQIITDKLSNVH